MTSTLKSLTVLCAAVVLPGAVASGAASEALAGTGELATNGCRVAWTDRTLEVGNRLFTRRYVAPIFGAARLSDVSVIGGRGTARFDGTRLSVTVPEQLDFVWVKFAVWGTLSTEDAD